ncbi:hypothetical protein E3U43_005994 [Larimichthys crocea]|uniref:Uncharacterized protein n=1 Tax=Larimichthys crocea TaxID=215358 RepID=A0ACD3QMK7_LARCR|nr:hypothetical protein E3U43_005994 [Larimichthys crocea]
MEHGQCGHVTSEGAVTFPLGRENKQEKEMEKMTALHLSSATFLTLSERD